MARIPAKIQRRSVRAQKAKMALDKVFRKRGRGRPGVIASQVRGRGDNYRWILSQVWDRLWPLLAKAKTEGEVVKAFQEGARPYDREFVPALAGLVIKVINEPEFPKRRKPQINFLADSLAGVGWVTPRRSRDICEQARANAKRAHHIIRYEFYVECSCGYRGKSQNHACPKCKARIDFGFGSIFGSDLT